MRTENLKYIKVDGGLVKNVLKDEVYKKSLRHIYSLTKEFGKQIVFEFIENEQIEKELRSISQNSALGQGYHYSRPKPLSEYIRD
jgi:EAL domain-containing protein (putative c-di-GMP-specific phosphodiesterase class I)